MLTVDNAVAELQSRCTRQWLEWLLGKGAWPIRIKLAAPKGAEFDRDVIGANNWAGTWQSAINSGRIPGSTEAESRRALKLGNHELPTTWIVSSPEDALKVAPEAAARYRAAGHRLQHAMRLPGVVWDNLDQIPTKTARTIADLDTQDWTNAAAVVTHLTTVGPGDAVMVRQLAIPGVHSRWIEKNATLIGAMLGVPADRSLGDPFTRLINHIGLKAKELPLHVTLACPQLRADAAGLLRFDATIPVLNHSALRPDTVLIVENLELSHTLPTELPGVATICGLGAGAPLLAVLNWIRTATNVLYWGDIDRAGLAILASVRRAGIPARAVMMDEATLDTYRTARHETDTQIDTHAVPTELTEAETALYARLNAYHQQTGRELQLEQEHIPIAQAHRTIQRSLNEL